MGGHINAKNCQLFQKYSYWCLSIVGPFRTEVYWCCFFKQKCIAVSFQTEVYCCFFSNRSVFDVFFLVLFLLLLLLLFFLAFFFLLFCIYFIDGLISTVAVERASQYIIILTGF